MAVGIEHISPPHNERPPVIVPVITHEYILEGDLDGISVTKEPKKDIVGTVDPNDRRCTQDIDMDDLMEPEIRKDDIIIPPEPDSQFIL